MSALTIGKLARQTQVTIETIRYYQRIGLLTEPHKPAEGYRIYSADTVARLGFIRRAQQLGFTLKEIGSLLLLDGNRCEDVRQIAIQKCLQIDEKIQDLTALRQALEGLVNNCQQTAPVAHCAILDAFVDNASTHSDL